MSYETVEILPEDNSATLAYALEVYDAAHNLGDPLLPTRIQDVVYAEDLPEATGAIDNWIKKELELLASAPKDLNDLADPDERLKQQSFISDSRVSLYNYGLLRALIMSNPTIKDGIDAFLAIRTQELEPTEQADHTMNVNGQVIPLDTFDIQNNIDDFRTSRLTTREGLRQMGRIILYRLGLPSLTDEEIVEGIQQNIGYFESANHAYTNGNPISEVVPNNWRYFSRACNRIFNPTSNQVIRGN